MNIVLGDVTLTKVTKYTATVIMEVAIQNIANVVETGQMIDIDTYAFKKPVYNISARVTTVQRNKLMQMKEDADPISFYDGFVTDSGQINNLKWQGTGGYNEHIVDIIFEGTNVYED